MRYPEKMKEGRWAYPTYPSKLYIVRVWLLDGYANVFYTRHNIMSKIVMFWYRLRNYHSYIHIWKNWRNPPRGENG